MAVFEPSKSKRNAKILVAAGYRPRTLREFLQNSLFYNTDNPYKYGEAAMKFLQLLVDQEGVPQGQWREILQHTELTHQEFYGNLRRKLMGIGMVRIVKGKYVASLEYSNILDILNTLWRGFLGEWE